MLHLATPSFPFDRIQSPIKIPLFHYNCVHNEMVCIANRILGVTPLPTSLGLKMMRRGSRILSRSIPQTQAESLGAFALKYSGHKRLRYLNACDKSLRGYSKSDAGVTFFVKREKMYPDLSKGISDPRPVQFRDPVYCVQVAKFLKPIECYLYNCRGIHSNMSSTRLVGKGLNQKQRAKLLFEKIKQFNSFVVLSLDCSRFDKHVSYGQLQIEHSVYLNSNSDPEFARLLSWQLINRCRSRSGYRYITHGKRMSGDMNTALGNCIIVISMVIGYMIHFHPFVKFDLLDDGDDCLLIVDEMNLQEVETSIVDGFLQMGHKLKVDKICRTMESVVWCQSSPVMMTSGFYKFVRDPIKTMSNDLVSSSLLGPRPKDHVKAVGMCELALNLGVPVLQCYALALIRNSPEGRLRMHSDMSLYLRACREIVNFDNRIQFLTPKDISFETRLSFSQAFGISIQLQLDLETHLDKWIINYDNIVTSRSYNDQLEFIRLKHECY